MNIQMNNLFPGRNQSNQGSFNGRQKQSISKGKEDKMVNPPMPLRALIKEGAKTQPATNRTTRTHNSEQADRAHSRPLSRRAQQS